MSDAESLVASVVIPTLNGGMEFQRVLATVLEQSTDGAFEVIVIDSGSTDGTLEFLAGQPVRLIRIDRSEFNHGLTRNLGVSQARGEIVALLSQDALPADEGWLQRLVDCFADERVAGAYSRQLPRSDANPLIRDRLEHWAASRPTRCVQEVKSPAQLDALSPMERLQRVAFDNVSSSVRRTVALELPFREVRFGEDLDWGYRAVRAGYRVVFEPLSTVLHSHNVSIWREFKRVYLDHQNLYRVLGLQTVPRRRDAARFGWQYARRLARVCMRSPHLSRRQRLLWAARAVPFGFTQVYAQFLGARSATWAATVVGRRVDRWLARGI